MTLLQTPNPLKSYRCEAPLLDVHGVQICSDVLSDTSCPLNPFVPSLDLHRLFSRRGLNFDNLKARSSRNLVRA